MPRDRGRAPGQRDRLGAHNLPRGGSRQGRLGEQAALRGAEASGRSLPPGSGKPWGPRAGQGPHEPPFSLRVSLCPRGMVVVADKTSELYAKTYWASYNIP